MVNFQMSLMAIIIHKIKMICQLLQRIKIKRNKMVIFNIRYNAIVLYRYSFFLKIVNLKNI